MKIELSEESSRYLLVTDIPTEEHGDLAALALYVTYRGDPGLFKALALDGKVIPQIVRAVNSYDALGACFYALKAWLDVHDGAGNTPPDDAFSEPVRTVLKQARAALARVETA